MATSIDPMSIQLQPQFASFRDWAALANREGFSFEISDLMSVPDIGAAPKEEKMEAYRSCGITVSIHGAFIDVNPASGDPLFRELSRRRCEESCHLAVKLGAENVVLHSSCFPFLRDAYLEKWARSCADFYEELVQRYPVNLYIENAQDLDPGPLLRLMEEFTSDRIGVCLDIGHAHYSRSSLEQWFACLQDRIGYLHLSDNLGAFDDHLPLGQGSIDWAQADRLYRALGREIPITLETGSLEATAASIRFLRKNAYFGLKDAKDE